MQQRKRKPASPACGSSSSTSGGSKPGAPRSKPSASNLSPCAPKPPSPETKKPSPHNPQSLSPIVQNLSNGGLPDRSPAAGTRASEYRRFSVVGNRRLSATQSPRITWMGAAPHRRRESDGDAARCRSNRNRSEQASVTHVSSPPHPRRTPTTRPTEARTVVCRTKTQRLAHTHPHPKRHNVESPRHTAHNRQLLPPRPRNPGEARKPRPRVGRLRSPRTPPQPRTRHARRARYGARIRHADIRTETGHPRIAHPARRGIQRRHIPPRAE